MAEPGLKHPNELITLSGGKGFQLSTIVPLLIGSIGACLILGGLAMALVDGPENLFLLIPGVFMGWLLLPGLHRTGVELDPVNSRFRSYDGPLGRNKATWIEVEEGDYLSIVGFTQTRSGAGRRPSASVTLSICKVFFWSGDWHLEVFKGYYEDSKGYAKNFADAFGLLINDVNKEQSLPEVSQGGF